MSNVKSQVVLLDGWRLLWASFSIRNDNNLESGLETGASFSVYQNGQALVDLWGGWADLNSHRHWQEDTVALTWSMVKGVTALVVARLVDSGVLEYQREVHHYWPEFGTEDKRNITVEMLLSHQAGLAVLDEQIVILDYQHNWPKVEKILAAQKPNWPPGTAVAYHAMTWGMYVDALVRKVDPQHRNVSEYFRQEIAKPLGLDYYIGLPPNLFHRFAQFREYSFWEQRITYANVVPAVLGPYLLPATLSIDTGVQLARANNPDVLQIGVPSFIGVGAARDLAKLYDYLGNNGTVGGYRLLSNSAVKLLKEPLTKDLPNLFFVFYPYSRGLFLKKNKQGHLMVGHSGYGGSYSAADTDSGLGMAYLTNHVSFHQEDPRADSLMEAFYECYETYVSAKKKNGQDKRM
ncbi:beta-lactamase domain-containing protein 2 isoform X2 [Aplysia californica]|uniref:Beta-lactamase domain-containing protein 2 isoform X2 n=1 Tax=Aplysia californica TaxID=6500 RepID=A0ABM1A4S5_APLCA|nr:beta-lactamase domain-containing protein 2 isoform X2 [Aplysia californica]